MAEDTESTPTVYEVGPNTDSKLTEDAQSEVIRKRESKQTPLPVEIKPAKEEPKREPSEEEVLDEDTKEKLEGIREVFQLFDKDGDGTISVKELGMVMKALGQNPTEAELLDIVSEVDKDGNGLIDFEEFSAAMQGIMKECDNEDDIKGAFRVFDKDGKGWISVEDLKRTIASLGEKFNDEEYDEMIVAADLDGDGQVTLDDFMELMLPKSMQHY